MINCYILLGGLTGGWLGSITSGGMLDLKDKLIATGFPTKDYPWGSWQKAWQDIHSDWRIGDQIVIIGYSGGGSRGTYLCNALKPAAVALFVAYDPSPAGQMKPISNNVRKAVCYYNTNPMMWWPGIGKLGGGQVTSDNTLPAPIIETIPITEWHLSVQSDQTLHARTLIEVRKLSSSNSR